MDPSEFARRVIEGGEADRVHILTHPQNVTEALERAGHIAKAAGQFGTEGSATAS
jgi:hypothetical protein